MNKSEKKWTIIAAFIAVIIICFALGENAGWPFLATPLENQLSLLMNRQVRFYKYDTVNLSKSNLGYNLTTSDQIIDNANSKVRIFQIYFLRGVTLKTANLYVAAPSWSNKPYFVYGNNILINLRYIDIWNAYFGHPIHIKKLQAQQLEVYTERKADGSASWQFNNKLREPNNSLIFPTFDQLLVKNGLLHLEDAPLKSNIEAKLSLISNMTAQSSPSLTNSKLTANATGHYNNLPIKIDLVSTGALPTNDINANKLPIKIVLIAFVGRTSLRFNGTTKNMLHPSDYVGKFNLNGPSLATVGDLIGVTLPTTAIFNASGTIDKQDLLWRTYFDKLNIGNSRLNGHFSYDKSIIKPLLTGQLAGTLVITDLGPAFGANLENKKSNRVLPSRPFDLASLDKMNADIMIDLQYLDLKTKFLEPFKPLQGDLQLKNSIITFKNINASTAEGRLTGDMSFDGNESKALWNAALAWNDVKLERWVKQNRADGLPPYISGKLNGKALLKGRGKSTAEILASLNGSIRTELVQGAVSHLGIELAGLDVAESIGVSFKGDDALPVQCFVTDLQAKNGVFTPRVMVVDTSDTTVWVDGSLSLAAETLNLRAMALPKDFSPLTLRAPLYIKGNFSNPKVSLDKKPVGLKLAASILLAIINPLAAVIPLLDTGNANEAKQHAAGCLNLMQKNWLAHSSAKFKLNSKK
jgi:uncharacterized protein involved in outer membrane biogenesis